jgi:putative transposase
VKFALIDAEKADFPIALMCRCLEVARSGYYAWSKRGPSARERCNRKLEPIIKAVHIESGRTYGSPRVAVELRAQGFEIGRHRVARLMRAMKVVARPRKRFVTPAPSGSEWTAAPNVLDRRFDAGGSERWGVDTTYIATAKGWLYLAVVIAISSRKIVGWSMSVRNDEELTSSALKMALALRPPPQLHHSDRGSPYTSDAYLQLLADHRIQPSMSRRGNCWDNAVVESFFSTLKTEAVRGKVYATVAEAQREIAAYLGYYNVRRRHSSLAYATPVEYERRAVAV